MIGHWIWVIVVGFVAGLIARFLIPGPNNPSGFIMTTVLGVVGSLIANFVAEKLGWIANASEGGHLLSGIVGAAVLLIVYHLVASQTASTSV